MADKKTAKWGTLPIQTLREYTDKRIIIYFANSCKKVGWVHAIDPVTRAVVLEEENESSSGGNSRKLAFVMGHAISHVILEEEDIYPKEGLRREINELIESRKTNEYSKDELAKLREEMIEWLTLNRVPVSQCPDNEAVLSVMGVLFLEPPYDSECCRCSNEIILDRVQKLIKAKQNHVTITCS